MNQLRGPLKVVHEAKRRSIRLRGAALTISAALLAGALFLASCTLPIAPPGPPAPPPSPPVPTNQAPLALFSVSDRTPWAGAPVTFDASASRDYDGFIATYYWMLGPGIIQTGVRVVQSFPHPGQVRIYLTVTDNLGAADTNSYPITVRQPDHCNPPGPCPCGQ